jgi:hypothetical protein
MNGYIDHYYVGEGGEDGRDFMDDNDEAYQRSVDEAIQREWERDQRRLRLERKRHERSSDS